MAVLLETSKGDLVVDLHTDNCPITARNFLKLCKIKYYNNCLFHNVQQNFIAQTGDPTGTGKGGDSIYGIMYGPQARFFEDEIRPHLRHKKKGVLGMASGGENLNASQFYITTGVELDSLDDKHTVFGEVTEGLDVLAAIDAAFVDGAGRPLQNVRIRHTIVLDDPFDDPPQLAEHIPDASPAPVYEQGDRLEDNWVPNEDGRSLDEIEEEARKREAAARAVVLEMIGDLPEADAKPPADMLFVCKLNPVTTEEDLEIIFSRFGTVTSCDIIRDFKTGDSLHYAFIGFDSERACEDAYFKMNNCLIDDRRIKVDFSQSVHHLWKQFRRFGRAGGAAEAAAAADVAGEGKKVGGAPGGPPNGAPRLELKPGAGGVYAGPLRSGRSDGGAGYGLLLDADDPGPQRGANGSAGARSAPAEPPASASGRHSHPAHAQGDRSRERGRERGRDRDACREDARRDGRTAAAEEPGGRARHEQGRDGRGGRDDHRRDRDRWHSGGDERRRSVAGHSSERDRGRSGGGGGDERGRGEAAGQASRRDDDERNRGRSEAGGASRHREEGVQSAGAEPDVQRPRAVREAEGGLKEGRRHKEHRKEHKKKHKKEHGERDDNHGDKRRRHD